MKILLLFVLLLSSVFADFDVHEKIIGGSSLNHSSSSSKFSNYLKKPQIWGTWRPNLYVGLRTRFPKSLLCGLMWTGKSIDNKRSYDPSSDIRHEISQKDKILAYEYRMHNGRDYSQHIISDDKQNILLETEWISMSSASSVDNNNNNKWVLRVKGEPIDSNRPFTPMILFYVGREGLSGISSNYKNKMAKTFDNDNKDSSSFLLASDKIKAIGKYNVIVRLDGIQNLASDPIRLEKSSMAIPSEDIWQIKNYIVNEMIQKQQGSKIDYSFAHDPHSKHSTSVVKLFFDKKFEFDIEFIGETETSKIYDDDDDDYNKLLKRNSNDKKILDQFIANRRLEFENKIVSKFLLKNSLRNLDINQDKSSIDNENKINKQVAVSALSNLLGGIGYFEGDWIANKAPDREQELFELEEDSANIDYELDDEEASKAAEDLVLLKKEHASFNMIMSAQELFTCTPSRSFFPRGFLWDEGFHQLVVSQWDPSLSRQIIESWVALIDEDGWVAREQILGPEARQNVPAGFVEQSSIVANPPAMFLAIEKLINNLKSIKAEKKIKKNAFNDVNLSSNVESLQDIEDDNTKNDEQGDDDGLGKNIKDIHLVQNEKIKSNDNNKNNYDEKKENNKNEETLSFLAKIYPSLVRHIRWIMRTQAGKPIIDNIQEESDLTYSTVFRWRGCTLNHNFGSGIDDYPRSNPPNVNDLHVDLGSWIAYSLRVLGQIAAELNLEDDVKEFTLQQTAIEQTIFKNFWDENNQRFGDLSGNRSHSIHSGYLSLLPFILGNSKLSKIQIKSTLDLMRNELLSPYGLRSLSKHHPLFRKGEDYWRGNIWANFQFLVLRALDQRNNLIKSHLANEIDLSFSKEYDSLYNDLRTRFIKTVSNEFSNSGHFFESYRENDGKGKGWHPFTGWTSIIALIISENYN